MSGMLRLKAFALLAGVAITWPLVARAQQNPIPVIGFLSSTSLDATAPFVGSFLRGLSKTGYVDGQNVAIEYRWAEGRYDRLPALADDLVSRKVKVIAAIGPAALAATSATREIPIVFVGGGDIIDTGLIHNLARPGGNLTGISIMATELDPKRLGLLSELVPRARVIALLVNPTRANVEPMTRNVQEAAGANGIQLQILKASTENEIDAAFATFVQQPADALLVSADPFFNSRRDQLVSLASRHAVPAIYQWREFALAGGLISYGSSLTDTHRHAGAYVGRILTGAKPADLPIEQPTLFELVINLKTAKALDLAVPQSMLARADEVIE
jgi:putative ABC transport system substrate-binding protein